MQSSGRGKGYKSFYNRTQYLFIAVRKSQKNLTTCGDNKKHYYMAKDVLGFFKNALKSVL
jgi:hypothetical protein